MKRFGRILKSLLVFLAVVMIPLASLGCEKKDDHTPTEQPSQEHPSGDQQAGDHPE